MVTKLTRTACLLGVLLYPQYTLAFSVHINERVRIHSRRNTIIYGIVLYCIVVGSLWLMPPDALQPKAYCTNPGL